MPSAALMGKVYWEKEVREGKREEKERDTHTHRESQRDRQRPICLFREKAAEERQQK